MCAGRNAGTQWYRRSRRRRGNRQADALVRRGLGHRAPLRGPGHEASRPRGSGQRKPLRLPRSLTSSPKRKAGTRAGLSKPAIVVAAAKLIESVGANGFSLRKLAKSLGVGPTTIHFHFEGGVGSVFSAVAQEALAGVTRPFKPKDEPAAYLGELPNPRSNFPVSQPAQPSQPPDWRMAGQHAPFTTRFSANPANKTYVYGRALATGPVLNPHDRVIGRHLPIAKFSLSPVAQPARQVVTMDQHSASPLPCG